MPPTHTNPRISQASVIDDVTDNLYTFFESTEGPVLSTFSLRTGQVTSAIVSLRPAVRWGAESMFTALWLPTDNKVVLFLAGTDAGYDSIVQIDAATGAGEYIEENLAESNLFFTCEPATKTCDVLQTAAYDAIEKRIYFQATQQMSEDDIGTTVLMYVDLAAKKPYIDTGLSPFTFGYLGFQFVSVQP